MTLVNPQEVGEKISAFDRYYPWPPRAEGREDIVGTHQLAGYFIQTALRPGGLYDAVDAWRQLFRGLGGGSGVVEFGKRLADTGRTRGQLVEKALTEAMRMPVPATELNRVFNAIAGQIVMYPVEDMSKLLEQRELRIRAINQTLEDDFEQAPSYYTPYINSSMLQFGSFAPPLFVSTGRVPAERESVPSLASLDLFTTNLVMVNHDPREDLL